MNGLVAIRRLGKVRVSPAVIGLMSMGLTSLAAGASDGKASLIPDSSDFMPHGFCYLWNPLILWLHVASDGLITLSYYCIPIILIYFVRKNRDIPFNRIFWMFGGFILACGTTHLMEIWNIWHASYLVAGILKAATAILSVITAAMLIPLVPKVMSLPALFHLQEVNHRLERQIAERKRFDAPIKAAIKRRITGGFMLALLLTFVIGYSSLRGARRAEEDTFWVSHTHEVMETIQRTTRHAIEAETAARAFSLTGQEPLLAQYQTNRDKTNRDKEVLRYLTADNLSQQRRLDVLDPQIHAALEFADSIIAKRRNLGAYAGESDALETEKFLNAVRATTRDMYIEETRLLNQRTERAQTGQQLTRIIALLGVLVGSGLWILAKVVVEREINISERARAQISTLNAELEERVERRTEALQFEIAEREKTEIARTRVLRELADQKFALDQHAIVATTDVRGTITYVNGKFCAISQYSQEELIGQNHRILNSGHHPKEFFQQMYHAIANGQVWRGDICNRAKDGSIYWVDTTVVPLLDASGKPRQYMAIRADITERKRTEELLNEQKYALDQHAIVATTDVQGTITYVNDRFCAISKYSEEELIGQNHRLLNSEHHPKEFFRQLYHTIANGGVWRGEICNRAKDGSIYWVDTTIVPLLDAAGKPRQYMAIRADISERKRAEEVREHLAAVVDSSDDAIISKTLDGIITAWNGGAQKVFGYSAEEMLGKSMLMLFPPERIHEEADILARVGRGVGVEHLETVRLRKDGTKIDISATISPIRDSSGRIVGASKIARDITANRKAADALRESEERFQAMANNIPQLAWMAEADGHIFWYNQRWYDYSGTTPEQMAGWGWQSLHDPDVLPQVLERWRASIAAGTAFEMEFPLRGADGTFRIFLTRIMPVKESGGRVVRWFGTNTDISALKEVEERLGAQAVELANSRHVLEEQARVLDLAPVMVRDMESRIVFWPRGAEKLYGIASQQAIGAVSHDLFHTRFPEPLEKVEKKLAQSGRWEGELVHEKADGTLMVVASSWVLYRDEQGQAKRILEVSTDITARKRAEERLGEQTEELSRQADELLQSQRALEKQSQTLKLVLESMSEGLIAADCEGHFLIWNDSASKLMGRGARELPSDDWTTHYRVFLPDGVTPHPPDRLPLVRALRGESVQMELMVEQPARHGVFLEVTARPLKDAQGTVCGGVAVLRDITERKASEREIQKLNQELEARVIERTADLQAANRELEAFTYSVSHDLRAPLRHISGFARILVEEFASTLPLEAQRHLERVEHGAQRMGQLVDELLNLARVGRQPLTVQITELNALVSEVIVLLEPEIEGRQVEWRIAQLPFLECDPVLIRQVFQNLIGNALKYSRPRSKAVIEIGHIEEDGTPAIFVKDNGVGFSMKYADKLFGVFQRLHRAEDFEGTGVGLATVSRIVQKHGGRVWANAELDAGATFYFTLSGREHGVPGNAAAAAGG